jgi:hypothetical protein
MLSEDILVVPVGNSNLVCRVPSEMVNYAKSELTTLSLIFFESC